MFCMQSFDASLSAAEEVGIRLVSFGQTITFHVQKMGFLDPSLIIFHGRTDDDQKVSLIQNVSQLSFLLIALEAEEPRGAEAAIRVQSKHLLSRVSKRSREP